MSLTRLSKEEIVTFIEEKGLDIDTSMTRAKLVDELMLLGVTAGDVRQRKPEKEEERVLVRMVRGNFKYGVRGYEFTKDHPILAVDADTAEYLLKDRNSFVPATPAEVKALYS